MSAAADDATQLLGLLADQTRLRVFAVLVLGTRGTAQIAERAGLAPGDAVRILARFEAAGLAVRVGDGWHACPERLREAVLNADGPPEAAYPGRTSAEVAVLRTYLVDGRIQQLPAQRAKRLVVLDHVAGTFEPGLHYSETEVGEALQRYTDDPTALRRHLVDEGFLGREGGSYWRTGGTFDVE
ncbi:DUF2087 domain-containing protein [Yinghuangia seranimata]|uniref:DUF2087 domain-containing protein n=1 Tax=Yinghuangia seranimata TaxID=408067 RepID=UPI00248BF9EE|nr:DUF2087 domain-containing protein [Yinghuangia seranimata]MDI2128057.1 DUF2087 domain-containing protein [Yinghuangia seranimata]